MPALTRGGSEPNLIAMEIERKFLVKQATPGLSKFACWRIRQGYFSLKQKDVQIRLREKGSRCFITIKAGRGKTRQEVERFR